jgi:hypothetical protein
MTFSLITRLLQVSPAVAGAVVLSGMVVGGQGGDGGRGGHGGHVGVEANRMALPVLALVRDVASHEGRYLASLRPAADSAWDGSAGWTISLRDASGAMVDGAELEVEAWQPEGTDAASQVAGARALGGGEYRVDGVALSSGWWNVRLAVAGAAGDSLAFNVVLR